MKSIILAMVSLFFLVPGPLFCGNRAALVFSFEPKYQASAARLSLSFSAKGFEATHVYARSYETFWAAFQNAESGLENDELFVVYMYGSSYHDGPATFIKGNGWSLRLDDFYRSIDPLQFTAHADCICVVLDVCRAGARPLEPAFSAGVGPLQEPPAGTLVLVPGESGRLLNPDEDAADLVSANVLAQLTVSDIEPFRMLQAAASTIDRASGSRLGSRVYAGPVLDIRQGTPSFRGLSIGMSLSAVLAALDLPGAFAGDSPAKSRSAAWTPGKGAEPALLTLQVPGYFDPREVRSSSGGAFSQTYAQLDCWFADGLLRKIRIQEASVGDVPNGSLDLELWAESLFRYSERVFHGWKAYDDSQPGMQVMVAGAAPSSMSEEYSETVRKLKIKRSLLGHGFHFRILLNASGASAGKPKSMDHYSETSFQIILEDEMAMSWGTKEK